MSRITMTKDSTSLRNGINIYNYALYHKDLNNVQMMAGYSDAFLEWIEFFQHAHDKSDDAFLEKLRTEEVKKAYERIRVKTLVRDAMALDDHHQEILGKVKVVWRRRRGAE